MNDIQYGVALEKKQNFKNCYLVFIFILSRAKHETILFKSVDEKRFRIYFRLISLTGLTFLLKTKNLSINCTKQ
jgi:hypothetical protein